MSFWTSGKSNVVAVLSALSLAALTSGCVDAENSTVRSPVDESPQGEGSASLAAYPPGEAATEAAATDDVAIGVDTTRYEDTDPSALTDFRPALAPYGTWEDTPSYGTVWVPSPTVVGADFVPYSTGGHWTYDGTWVWVSDYEWGWAPFHYGRWVHVPARGWAWVPGRTYAGAWVTWSVGPTYVGWAPLAPSWYWYDGYAVGVNVWAPPYYMYCAHHDVFAPRVSTVVVHGPSAGPIAASTRPYVPAQPSVGGPSHIPATPTVGSGRIPAAPTPGELGHAAVPKPPSNPGLAKARAFADPSLAVREGARAPATGAGFASSASGAPRYAPSARDAFAAQASSSGGGDSGARASARAAIPPPAAARSAFAGGRSVTLSSPSAPMGRAPSSPVEPVFPPAATYRSPTGVAPTAPGVRGTTTIGGAPPSAPVYRPAPSYTPPPSAPVYRSSTPTFTPPPSAPVYRPTPSYTPPPSAPVYRPTPSYTPPPSAPVYRPSAPTFTPPPSAPVYRPSTPPPVVRPQSAPVSRPSTPAPSHGVVRGRR